MTELHDLTALQLAAAYERGETSPTEVVDHLLARIGDGDRVGAFTTVSAGPARAASAEAERVLRSSDRTGLPRLFGVPTAIKDLEATAGVRTTLGSALFRDWIPGHDDEIVEVMADAGLISLGKTTVPEFGAACYTEPEVSAPARSPFDPTRSAAAAVVARPRRSAHCWCRSRRAATPPVRCVPPRAPAGWSGSSPAVGSSPRARPATTGWGSRYGARWPAPCATPPRSWTR